MISICCVSGLFTYSIDSGNTHSSFKINPFTGEIIIVKLLDYEQVSGTSYTLIIHAIDQGSTAKTGIASVTVTVVDKNDNRPVCSPGVYGVSLAENTRSGTTVPMSVSCTDEDGSAPNNVLVYTIDSGNTNSAFSTALTASGDLVTDSVPALNRENKPYFDLNILVTDKGSLALTTTIQMAITITDVNENSPVFSPASYSAYIDESTAVGTLVSDTNATDNDGDAVTFSITNGNANNMFDINAVTGEVTVGLPLDREDTSSYSLTIEATDGTNLAATATLDITLADVNDKTPNCTFSPYSFNIDEDAAVAATVGSTISCSDDDTDANAFLTYYWSPSGSDPASGTTHFDISSSGVVTVAGSPSSLDYDLVATQYTLLVDVKDAGSPVLTGTATIIVVINPINDFHPVFSGTFAASISEGAGINDLVHTVTATDEDRSTQKQGKIRYSIASTVPVNNKHFSIDIISGEIKVATPLDYETTNSYTLTILAEDGESGDSDIKSETVDVTLTVTNVNDVKPVFSPNLYSVTIQDSHPTSTLILTLNASDTDSAAASLTFTFVDGDDGKFSFNTTGTGSSEIHLGSAPLQAETKALYEIQVRVEDNGSPNLSGTGTIVVNVEPTNQNSPIITVSAADPFNITIDENLALGSTVCTFVATDADGGVYGTAGPLR